MWTEHADPFALFVGFYRPHAPFQIGKKYLDGTEEEIEEWNGFWELLRPLRR